MTLIAHVRAQITAGAYAEPDPEAAAKLEARRHWRTIVREVADKHGLTPDELLRPSAKHKIAHPRQEAMFRARHETPLSLPEIGRRLGGLHHSTVIHGVRAYAKRAGA